MVQVYRTEAFSSWLESIGDKTTKGRILIRIDRLQIGLVGDSKFVGSGVFELRFNFGPGYRVYFAYRGKEMILLLVGGDKSSQNRDIAKAKLILKSIIGGKDEKG